MNFNRNTMRVKRTYIEKHPDIHLLQEYYNNHKEEIIQQLYVRYIHYIYGISLKYIKDRINAQKFTLSLYEKLPVQIWNQKPLLFKDWLYTFVLNECKHYLNSKGKQDLQLEYNCTVSKETKNENSKPIYIYFSDEQYAEKIEKCIKQLSPVSQTIATLFYKEQKNTRTISKQMNIDPKKVINSLLQTQEQLIICLEKDGNK
ncbi:MAG: sigma-70 family RNA polymerase sigma factor [Bacteroidales bacterium]